MFGSHGDYLERLRFFGRGGDELKREMVECQDRHAYTRPVARYNDQRPPAYFPTRMTGVQLEALRLERAPMVLQKPYLGWKVSKR